MTRYLVPMMLAALLSGCGLAETAGTTAALAEAEAQNAKAAKETQTKIEQQLQAAQEAQAKQLKGVDAASE